MLHMDWCYYSTLAHLNWPQIGNEHQRAPLTDCMSRLQTTLAELQVVEGVGGDCGAVQPGGVGSHFRIEHFTMANITHQYRPLQISAINILHHITMNDSPQHILYDYFRAI